MFARYGIFDMRDKSAGLFVCFFQNVCAPSWKSRLSASRYVKCRLETNQGRSGISQRQETNTQRHTHTRTHTHKDM